MTAAGVILWLGLWLLTGVLTGTGRRWAETNLRVAGSSVLVGFTSSILGSVVLVGTGVKLFRFLSPNTARGALHRPENSLVCLERVVEVNAGFEEVEEEVEEEE